jgi:putative hydrolase of the HAD superfamily
MLKKPGSAYKNVVFDMGMVLADYDGRAAIRQFTDDPAVIREIWLTVFVSYDWAYLDMGALSEEEFLAEVLPRLSSYEVREIARKAFLSYDQYNLHPKRGMDKVMEDLVSRGQEIYVLSNAGVRLRKSWTRFMPRPDLISGILFSAEELCLKPEKVIYRRFFEKFGLRPEECVFIDDLRRNVDAAEREGMDGWCFSGGDVGELREILGLSGKME